ncbi:DeoR/GlpR transcriptional regulator [Collinsella sp. AF23-4AC]|nr:DeoR/GlpR transcriptional regulator [Collinsella sp. AF23-4AC]
MSSMPSRLAPSANTLIAMFGPFSSNTIAIESLLLCFKSFSVFFYKPFQKLSKAQLSAFRERSNIGRERTSFGRHLQNETLYSPFTCELSATHAFMTCHSVLLIHSNLPCSFHIDTLYFDYERRIFLPFVQKERHMASTSDLSPAERQRFIMNWLAEKPNISVSDIVRRFSVSEVTARHDLISLESEGKLRRVRGGAVSLSRSNAISYPEERINVQVEAKEAIAATAATLVDDGDVLVIDIGTTGFYFAKALMDKREITIITGDLAIANYASFNLPNASVVLLGGSVRKGHLYLAGALTLDCMSKLHADKAFVSADGFHPDHGFTVEHDFSAMIKHMYLTNSNQGYMMVDQGKFNKTSFYQSAQIDDLDGIIVDGDDESIMTAAIESSRSHPKLYIAK